MVVVPCRKTLFARARVWANNSSWLACRVARTVEFLFKLRKIKDILFTETGRAIARERHQYLQAYFERVGAEIRGEL